MTNVPAAGSRVRINSRALVAEGLTGVVMSVFGRYVIVHLDDTLTEHAFEPEELDRIY